MQIACKKFGCQKAVQVCYWSCKFRKKCKDWQGALDENPGTEAMRGHLEAASKKSGRLFDAETMIIKKGKTRKSASITTTQSIHLKSRAVINQPREQSTHLSQMKLVEAAAAEPVEAIPAQITTAKLNKSETIRTAKTNIRLRVPRQASIKTKKAIGELMPINNTNIEDSIKSSEPEQTVKKSASTEKPVETIQAKTAGKTPAKIKQKSVKHKISTHAGPIYLLLYANGKYRELRESELQAEAAVVLKDSTLRLVKGQFMIPQITFTVSN